MQVITTAKAPFHKADLEITVTEALGAKMIANGWAVTNVDLLIIPAKKNKKK